MTTRPSTRKLTAAAVSRQLRAKGHVILGSGTSYMREGTRVRQSGRNTVWIAVDLDSQRNAKLIADDLMETLALIGYSVERTGDAQMNVRRA